MSEGPTGWAAPWEDRGARRGGPPIAGAFGTAEESRLPTVAIRVGDRIYDFYDTSIFDSADLGNVLQSASRRQCEGKEDQEV